MHITADQQIRLNSISELHKILGYDSPRHPLVTLVDFTKIYSLQKYERIDLSLGFYCIALKSGRDCDIKYGRQTYDFAEGSLVFSSPNQVATIDFDPTAEQLDGWLLCFHEDLIRGSALGKSIHNHTYFDYASSEALHLSADEKTKITRLVETIQQEYSANLDTFSLKLIVSHLEVMLNYCERFYARQFITRHHVNSDVISQFEALLKSRLHDEELSVNGIPSVRLLASELAYTPNYLSDLLKKETGKTAQDHIYDQLISIAKHLLLQSNKQVSQIAYDLGYEYPEHFSRFFKGKLGLSPNAYRKQARSH